MRIGRRVRVAHAVQVAAAWPGSTVVCAGSGPSLAAADLDAARAAGCRVIAVNDAYRLAPWADVLYACDSKWWAWHKGAVGFAGRKFALAPQTRRWPDVAVLAHTGRRGLDGDRGGLRSGYNSGYQAINLAVHLGAARILLLGYDMQGDHFFGAHPDQSRPPFAVCLREFPSLAAPLAALGIDVVNCTPGSALRVWPVVPLAVALEGRAA